MSAKGDKSESAPRNRGGRLARRARSFKEDLLERIIQMRSPSSTRAASPHKILPKVKLDRVSNNERRSSMGDDGQNTKALPEEEVVIRQKEVLNALRYFRGVVENKSFTQLPGSASAVLDAVLSIHNTFQNCFTNEQSSLLVSSNNQVYQSLANLVRWADVVLLQGEGAFNKDGVNESVNAVESAVKTLLNIVLNRLKSKELREDCNLGSPVVQFQNGLLATKQDPYGFITRDSSTSHPTLQRDLEIIQSSVFPGATALGHSISSDSILGSVQNSSDDIDLPPPKPPLPNGKESFRPNGRLLSTGSVPDMLPPALPPKKRPHLNSCASKSSYSTGSFFCFPSETACRLRGSGEWDARRDMSGSNWSSPIGHSPSSVSPLSASASSLDSTPNCSADDLLERVHSDVDFPCRSSSSSFGYQCRTNHSIVWSEAKSVEKVELVQRRFQEMSCLDTSPTITSMSFSRNLQNIESTTATTSSTCSRTSSSGFVSSDQVSPSTDVPPAVPPKRRTANQRTPSQYDNVPDFVVGEADCSLLASTTMKSSQQSMLTSSDGHSLVSTCRSSSSTSGISDCEPLPPPLPLKKKHVMAYMQMFGCMDSNSSTHYMHSCQFVHREMTVSHSQMTVNIGHTSSADNSVVAASTNGSWELTQSCEGSPVSSPPALPPKKGKVTNPSNINYSMSSNTSVNENEFNQNALCNTSTKSPLLLHKDTTGNISLEAVENRIPALKVVGNDSHLELATSNDIHSTELQILDELDARPFLIYKKKDEDGPDIRGGPVSALVVHATFASKNEIIYQDAFMTTYRTFMSPVDLVRKLLYRYDKFGYAMDVPRQRVARSAFSLLVRVVGDFSVRDIDIEILKILMDFVFKLLCNGELTLARALRKKVLEKWEAKLRAVQGSLAPLSSKGVSTKQGSLLDFKSEQLAEQMTLLDADLFQKIEIAEVLIWSRLQKEESSPNLTTFTEHFNKMSYWARSRILEKEDAKDREHYVIKFIKIMKHLRKMNNFNSYLAILSALDSAPIRRLEWQRHITEGLKEYCELIDSSSSFRAYRQALAETEPPCIPYIGLILQDLTFVHIGNSDFLPDGNVNFSKRWQQFNILDVMRRFRKCQYNFKRNERIIAFFNNFDDHLCEEAMWQISESIKPRTIRKKADQTVQ